MNSVVQSCERELVRAFACCEKGKLIACTCAFAFVCPVHGEDHVAWDGKSCTQVETCGTMVA